jgi:phosphatidylinositol alpha-mannosyltransferase
VNSQLSCAKRRRVTPRVRLVVVSLVVGVGLGLAALALTRLNLSRSLHALANVRPGFAALTFALLSASLIARAECWYVILRGTLVSTRISRLVSTRATMIGVMVSATVPGRLGEPARVFVVARRTDNPRNCIALVAGTVLAQTLLNMAALLALASVLLASFTLSRNAAWAIGLATAIPIVGVAVILTGPKLLDRAARKTTALGRAASFARTETKRIRAGLRVFRRPRDTLHATAAQLAAWSLQLLACDALLSAFGIATPARLGTAAAVLVATNVAAVVPVTPGNVGVFQAACVAVLAAYGVGAGRALAYGIGLQLLEVTTAIALGLPALLAEGLKPRDLRRATQHEVTPDRPSPPSKPRPGSPPADRAAADPGS